MKKILLTLLLAAGFSSFAQNAIEDKIAEETCKTLAKDKANVDKAILDPKKGIKAATWTKRANTYLDLANFCFKTDSNAAIVAYESLKKALEVEPAAKSVKETNALLNGTDEGTKLYSALFNSGIRANEKKSFKEAMKFFAMANDMKSADTTGYLYAGYMARELNDEPAMVKYFEKSVANGLVNKYVYIMLSQAYKNAKQTDKAMAILKVASGKFPTDKDLKGEIINMNIAGGKSDEVIADLKKLVDVDPNNVGYLSNLAIVLQQNSKMSEAMTYYDRVLKLEPNNFDTNFNLGVYHFNEGVILSGVANKMDMATYKKEGKAAELKACDMFKKSTPYFEAAYISKKDDDQLNESIKNAKDILEKCSKIK